MFVIFCATTQYLLYFKTGLGGIMPLTGKQLIEKAIRAAGDTVTSEAKALDHIISNRQSTHIDEVEGSVFNSTVQLYELYKPRMGESDKILADIRKYINSLPGTLKSEAATAFVRVEHISIDNDGKRVPYGRLESQRGLALSAKDALVLAWMGAIDPKAMKDSTLSQKDIEDRKCSLIKALCDANNEYGPNNPACYGGTFHALINSLSSIHQSVQVILDKKQALSLITSGFKPQVKEFFDKKSPEEQKAILAAWGLGEPDNAKAVSFVEEAKEYISEILKNPYKGIITQQEISELVIAMMDGLEKVDLMNLQIYNLIKQKTKEVFETLPPKTQQKVLDVWGQENKNAEFEEFIAYVEVSLYKHPKFLELFGVLNRDEFTNLRRSITELEKHELAPVVTVSATADEDKALKDHPNWIANRKANTLVIVAKDYTAKKNYNNVLKSLLGMVSAEAVAEAVLDTDSENCNALIYAARFQNADNFNALVNKLYQTPKGQQVLLTSIQQMDNVKRNAFIEAALNQSGFMLLVNKVMSVEGGPQALLNSMESRVQISTGNVLSRYNKYDIFMVAAQYQKGTEFIAFVDKILSLENGRQILLNSIKRKGGDRNSGDVFMVAARYQTKNVFIDFINKISNTKEGLEALSESMSHVMDIRYDEYDDEEEDVKCNILMVAAQFQTDGGFIAFVEKLLSAKGGRDKLAQLLHKNEGTLDDNNALKFAMQFQNFKSLSDFIKICKQSAIQLDIKLIQKSVTLNQSLTTSAQISSIIKEAAPLAIPSVLEKTKQNVMGALGSFGFLSGTSSGSSHATPDEKDSEVKVHIAQEEDELQKALLESYTTPSKKTSRDETELRNSLRQHMETLQGMLLKTETETETETVAPHDRPIISIVVTRIRAVLEEKEGKRETVQSLFDLEKDLSPGPSRNTAELCSSSVATQSIFSQPPQSLQPLPQAVQDVISLINDFKKNNVSYKTGKI